MKKKLLAFLCVLTCVFSLAACGSSETYTAIELQKLSNAEEIASDTLQLVMASGDSATELTSMYNKEEMAALYQSTMYSYFSVSVEAELGAFDGLLTTYAQMLSDMGGLNAIGDYTSEISGDEILVTYEVDGVECDGSITLTFSDDIFCRLEEGDCVADTSFSQKMSEAGKHMGTAGLNTLLGMGTVFIMLIIISFIIEGFKYISKAGKKPAKEEPVKQTEAPVTEEPEELTDDTELVAVITAAISAYESANGGSSDGFVVRSIKKANRRM